VNIGGERGCSSPTIRARFGDHYRKSNTCRAAVQCQGSVCVYCFNTSNFSLKISTKDSTEGSNIRPLRVPVRLLKTTNAATLKVRNYTATTTSGIHNEHLRWAWATTPRALLFMASAAHEVFEFCKPLTVIA